MTATHTPGPWTRKFGQHIYQGKGPFDTQRLIATGMPTNGTREELDVAFANAKLIAAAPDLLGALKSIMDGGIADPAEVAKAHAAIAKAEGRA